MTKITDKIYISPEFEKKLIEREETRKRRELHKKELKVGEEYSRMKKENTVLSARCEFLEKQNEVLKSQVASNEKMKDKSV